MNPIPDIIVRPAAPQDSRFIYDVAVDPTTRANSTRPESFSFDHHQEWYARMLSDRSVLFLVVVAGEAPVGYVRYQLVHGELRAQVSIAIARVHRGSGFARRALDASEAQAYRALGATILTALILPDNVASVRTFADAGYRYVGTEQRLGRLHLRWDKTLAQREGEVAER